jgi:hypothetical protein
VRLEFNIAVGRSFTALRARKWAGARPRIKYEHSQDEGTFVFLDWMFLHAVYYRRPKAFGG